MRVAGLKGVHRGRKPHATVPKPVPDKRPDLVNRDFTAEAPNRLWVADITYVRVRGGFAYTAFISDVCTHKIVGWAVSQTMETEDLPLLALEHALVSTGATRCASGHLIHHCDRGSQYVSLVYSNTLKEAGITASVGTVGDSYDNAMAQSVNGLYKAEIIHAKRIWDSVAQVELATFEWVHWWNTQRLHESLEYLTPNEAEASYHQANTHQLAVV